jgi:hypothetical protein
MAIQDLTASLDLKQNLNIYATCKQFDNLNLILSIFDNSLQADLTNYDVRLRAMKADNVPLIQQHIGIDIDGNVVNIQADEQLTTTAGNTPVELQFIDKSTGEKKATFNLVLVVVASAIAIEASISKATYTLLEELEKKLDQLSDFFEHIGEAIEANTNLETTISNSETAKNNLDGSISAGNTLKVNLDNTFSIGNTLKTNLENDISTGNTLKDDLEGTISTGDSLLNSLETFEQEHADVTDISNKLADINAGLSNIIHNNKSLDVGVSLGGRNPSVIDNIGVANLKTYGITSFRLEVLWSKVETVSGAYDFSYYDSTIMELINNGIRPIITLGRDNSIYSTGSHIVTDTARAAFINYVKATVNKYKNYNVSWEVWNEPNLEYFWNDQANASNYYYLLIKDTYNAIKAINSNHKVYGCCLAESYRPENGYQYRVSDFFINFCVLGGLNYMDALSIHPYSVQEPEMLGIIYNTYKGLIGTFNNKDMEIAITEFGYPIPSNWDNLSMPPLPSLSDTQRGQYFLRSFMANLINGISTQSIHELYSPQSNNTDSEYWFSLFNADYSPTTSATMIKNFLSSLGNGSELLFHEQPRSADYFVYFKKADNSVICVYWTRNDEHTITNRGINFDLTQTPQIVAIDSSLIDLDSVIKEYNKKTINDNGDVLYSYNNALVKTPDGGGVFGSTKYNYAGINSTAFGNMNLAYSSNVYGIKTYTNGSNIITLGSVSGLAVGNNVIIKHDWNAIVYAEITAIDTTYLTVTLNKPVYTGAKYLLYRPSNFNPNAAFAEGANNLSTGYASCASGVNTFAGEEGAHSEGSGSKATNLWSHAQNKSTQATERASTAMGDSTTANNYACMVMGKYNKPLLTGGASNNQIGDAFVIGNGTSSSALSNGFRVNYGGGVYGTQAYNATGADYAEFFEWSDENINKEDRCGYFVTTDGDKIKIATTGDYILGVVSANPCIIGNSDEDWLGKYAHDDFGRFIYEDVEEEIEQINEETREVTLVKTGSIIKNGRLKLSANYDQTKEYIQRANRPEWDTVGMLGVLAVRDDGSCQVNGYCSVNSSGIAITSEKGMDTYRVISRVNDNIIKIIFK